MASGHVNRTQRPNTWLHRPSLRREDSPCQLGAVHTWPLASFRRRILPHCENVTSASVAGEAGARPDPSIGPRSAWNSAALSVSRSVEQATS